MEIVDQLAIPPQLPGGDYVLGWRWDCASPASPLFVLSPPRTCLLSRLSSPVCEHVQLLQLVASREERRAGGQERRREAEAEEQQQRSRLDLTRLRNQRDDTEVD